MVTIDGEEYLTGEEAARLLRVKRATLYAYVSRGVLRSYRQGIKRERLYRRSELEDLLRLDAGDRGAADAPPTPPPGAEPLIVWNIPPAESWIRD
jgi:citrate synthase